MARNTIPFARPALALVAMVAILAAVVVVDGAVPSGGGALTPGEELANKQRSREAKLAKREVARTAAAAAGHTGQQRPAAAAAAVGWAGEQPLDTTADDWEPAIAADPTAPYVYTLVTRYTGKPCQGNCPSPWMALEVSSDGGATWTNGAPLCACKGSGQFDPIIEVVPGNGHVYAVYMNGFNVVFVKSTNHGASWSAPVKTYGNVSWNDKPVLAMSDDGRDVYVTFNGPTGGDPWVAQSHDFGATWAQVKLVNGPRYFFAFDADVAPDGTVYLGQSAIQYGGGGNKGTYPAVPIDEHVFVSTDRGATWTDRLVASVQPGPACVAAGCSPDYYLGHHALTVDAAGRVVLLYDGAATSGAPQAVVARSSTNRGASWSAAVTLSKAGENAVAPAAEARGAGDVRAWWYETAAGNADAWNIWYRRSTDGGATWSAAVKISDATAGAGYKTAAGFQEIYGDYGELAITSAGKSIAIWGEGFSYEGPGSAWFNREP